MSNGTSTGTRNGIAIGLVVIAMAALGWALLTNPEGPSELPPMPEDDNQVFVDLAALWNPRGDVEVSWQIGGHIQGPEHFTVEDPGRFGLRIVIDRGTQVVLLVEGPVTKTCEIRVNEREQVVEDTVEPHERCRVELTT